MRSAVKCAVCLIAALAAVASAHAGPVANVAPKTREALDAMAAFYKGINSVSCSYTLDLQQEMNGKTDAVTLDFAAAFERPNKVSFVQGKSDRGIDVVSDGKEMAVSIPSLKKYVIEPAPGTIADALEWGALTALTGFNAIFGELMGPDPAAALLDGVSAAEYVGEEDLNGAKHHHIRLIQDDMNVDMWIASGEKPFLARMAPDVAKAVGDPSVKIALRLDFTNWEVNATAAPERFVFTAPATSTKTASFEEMFGGGGAAQPALGLVGKPASAFALKGLDGAPIDLQAHLGKNIIVVDFWATWCPPCVKTLPIIAEITASYKDKGVVFVAVNLGEGPDEVNAFLKEQGLAFTVALDSDRTAAEAYLVDGIPQTVLIGKSGTIEAVHVGGSPVLRQQLKRQLSALVAGQSLAAAKS